MNYNQNTMMSKKGFNRPLLGHLTLPPPRHLSQHCVYNLQGNDAGFDADLDADLDTPPPPPPELEDLSTQLDRGLPTFNIDGSRTRCVIC